MAMTYVEAAKKYGAAQLKDKNGKPLTAAALAGRIKKLEKEADARQETGNNNVADNVSGDGSDIANDEGRSISGSLREATAEQDRNDAPTNVGHDASEPVPSFDRPAEAPTAGQGQESGSNSEAKGPGRILPDLTQKPAETYVVRAIDSRFKIEDGYSLPARSRGGVRGETRYPFAKLAIGQSFFVPATAALPKPWTALSPMGSRAAKDLYPRNFTARRVKEDGVDGCRVWRTEDLTAPKPPRASPQKSAG